MVNIFDKLLVLLIYIDIFGTLFMPYIMGIILSVIIICIIRKKLIKKDKKFKGLIYAIIILFCMFICIKTGYALLLYLSAKPDKIYVQMNEINESQELIGLSKEQVVKILGKPEYKENGEDVTIYVYDAGKITNYLFLSERDFYQFRIVFNENNNVKSTSIKEMN